MYYRLDCSKTGTVKIEAYQVGEKNLKLGAHALLFLTEISDTAVEKLLETLDETRVASARILSLCKFNDADIEKLTYTLRTKFPFRTCTVCSKKVEPIQVIEICKGSQPDADLCILDAGAFMAWSDAVRGKALVC